MATATTTARLGHGLADLRRARGLTQIQLATEVGCSVSYVRQLEQGGLPQQSSDIVRRIFSTLNDESPAANGALDKERDVAAHHGS